MNQEDLAKAVALVAGATGCLGNSVCTTLRRQGATIVSASRSTTHACDSHLHLPSDLRTPEEWVHVIRLTLEKFHRIDIFVNCVGILRPGALDQLSVRDCDDVLQTNVAGLVYGIKAILPVLIRQGSGHIITLGSLGGIVPMANEALYCATKFAARGLSLSLSKELKATGVSASLISAGPVHSSMLKRESADQGSWITFVNRPLDPEDVAQAVLSVIHTGREEIVMPRWSTLPALLCNWSSRIFSMLYPILRYIGAIGLRRYQQRISPLSPNLASEATYE